MWEGEIVGWSSVVCSDTAGAMSTGRVYLALDFAAALTPWTGEKVGIPEEDSELLGALFNVPGFGM